MPLWKLTNEDPFIESVIKVNFSLNKVEIASTVIKTEIINIYIYENNFISQFERNPNINVNFVVCLYL